MMYVEPKDYYGLGYDGIPSEELTEFLKKASRQIDELTFNRIMHYGFDRLTPFQRDIVQTVICEQAEFLFDNNDIINSALNEYSINGVSMKFGNSVNVEYISGVPIERKTYALLKQTGLCCRLAV